LNEAVAALGAIDFSRCRIALRAGGPILFYAKSERIIHSQDLPRYLIRPEPPVPDFVGIRERQAFGKKENSAVILTDGRATKLPSAARGHCPTLRSIDSKRARSEMSSTYFASAWASRDSSWNRAVRTCGKQSVDIIDITDADNRTVTVYFSHVTTSLRQVTIAGIPRQRKRSKRSRAFPNIAMSGRSDVALRYPKGA